MGGSLLPSALGWWVAAVVALLALAAEACGGGNDGSSGDATASPTATGTPSGDETPSGTPTPAGTTTVDDASDGLIVLEGVFEKGLEHSAFYPEVECPVGAERYWVSWLPESRFDGRIEEQTGTAPFGGPFAEPDVRAFAVTIRGELSQRGDFGHLGQYPREVTVHELIDAALLSGCDDNGDGSGSGGGAVPLLPTSPPPVLAAGGDSEVALGLGSYCWTAGSGQPGLCADTIGIITNAVPLVVTRGETVELTTSLDLAGATQLGVRVQPPGGAPIASGAGWLAWTPSTTSAPLDVRVGPPGATFVADLAPGRYVVALFVAVAQGDAGYGLLLEVETAPPSPSIEALELGDPALLAVGRDVGIVGGSDVLTFAAVSQDSRCPTDAVCVWAGEAVLAFVLHEDGLAIGRSIAVSPDGSAAAVLGSYRLTVLDVGPEATTAGSIAQSDYRATVVLERARSQPAGSGVRGVVTLGPLCPVQREDQPCPDRAFVATLVLRDASGSELDRVTSGVDGSYQIAAAPGVYVLDPQPLDGRPLPHVGPIDVAVEAGAWTTVDVAYDSGIR